MPHLPDHQTSHDPLLIAAFASGDAEGADLERARDLVATCDECAALHHDLRSIGAAMPALPVPARTRDFRLTPEQAASLRPAGWRRLLAPLAGPRFAFAAPLGGSLAALGIAGILVAGAAGTPISGQSGGTSGASAERQLAAPAATGDRAFDAGSRAASQAPDPAPPEALAAASAGPIAGTGPAASADPLAGTGLAAGDGAGSGAASGTTPVDTIGQAPSAGPLADTVVTSPSSGLPLIVPLASGVLLLVGAVLLALRLAGRRLGART